MIPDIIRGDVYFLAEERAEEVAIFILGSIAFLTFIQNERRMAIQKKEKERTQKKMDQAVKDLVDSYSYIGEVNRKMDILMEVALGLADHSILDRKKEKETYDSIINAANFLLKAESTTIRFINLKTNKTEKEIWLSKETGLVMSNEALTDMGENINIKKQNDALIVSSPQRIRDVKSYLVIKGYDENEEGKPKNMEILKLFASQAIFLYSYMLKEERGVC
ncbi:MAG: hypothetical protein NTY33_03480 [Candidatus Moranbacteria bacterium]|nr:hypothetical protein [Candidatus Moranbacteria bacterium]